MFLACLDSRERAKAQTSFAQCFTFSFAPQLSAGVQTYPHCSAEWSSPWPEPNGTIKRGEYLVLPLYHKCLGLRLLLESFRSNNSCATFTVLMDKSGPAILVHLKNETQIVLCLNFNPFTSYSEALANSIIVCLNSSLTVWYLWILQHETLGWKWLICPFKFL